MNDEQIEQEIQAKGPTGPRVTPKQIEGARPMSSEKFEAWAIVELMGRSVIAGRLSDQVIGGDSFLRVDIPRSDGSMYTRLFTKSAIYAINICEESTARNFASQMYEPLRPYTALPAPAPVTETGEQLAERLELPVNGSEPDPDEDSDEDDWP